MEDVENSQDTGAECVGVALGLSVPAVAILFSMFIAEELGTNWPLGHSCIQAHAAGMLFLFRPENVTRAVAWPYCEILSGTVEPGQVSRPCGRVVASRLQRKQMARAARAYDDYLRESLKDPVEASAYLQVSLEDGNPSVFLMALRNVALAHGGLRDLSKKTELNRETLYRILSEKGNPALVTVNSILQALGLQIMIAPKKRKMKRAA
jgi:probable addiction module antidote protein